MTAGARGPDFPAVAARLRMILEANTDGMKLTDEPNGAAKLERIPATCRRTTSPARGSARPM